MAVQINLKLQTPTIELPVVAKDAAGNTESLKIGFKRYDVEQTRKKFEELTSIYKRITEDSPDTEELDNFIRNEVVYIKGASISISSSDSAIEKEITIADSRTVKAVDGLWSSNEECVDVLLRAYLNSAPYRAAINTAMSKALLNNDFKEASAKNL